MAEMRDDRPRFEWPADLAVFDPARHKNIAGQPSQNRWHLDRCKFASQNGRKDVAYRELIQGTPSLRRKDSGDVGPVVIVEPPT